VKVSKWLAALGMEVRALRAGPAPGRLVAWLGGAFIVVVVALAGYDIVRSYHATVEQIRVDLDTQSRVITEQTARTVQAIDTVLRHLAEQSRRGLFDRLDSDALHAYLQEQTVGLVQIDGLAVFNVDGTARAATMVPRAQLQNLNATQLPAFQRLRDNSHAGLAIGTTFKSASTGRHVIPIGRRLDNAHGELGGLVGGGGRVDYFQTFYRDAYPAPGTRIALLHRDGTLLARHPPADAALGQRLDAAELRTLTPDVPATSTRATSPVDGTDRFASLRLVPDYPLIVVVSRESAAALAPWRAQATGSALRTLAMAALAGWLIALAVRHLARLRASEERFAIAVAGSDDGIWVWDFVNNTAYASRRALELSGVPDWPELQSIEEWHALMERALHPDDVKRRRAAIAAHIDGRTPALEIEYRLRMTAGGYRWLRIRGMCVRDAHDKPLRMAGSSSDIDARKRFEEELRQSEDRFAVAVAGSADGIWVIDFGPGTAYASERAREIFGRGWPELQSIEEWNERMDARLEPADKVRRQALIDAHLAGETPFYEFEYRVRETTDRARWIRARGKCTRDAEGKLVRFAGSVSDIDEKKNAEEALRRSDERYQLAVSGSNEGLWDWDLKSDMLFLSPRAQLLTFAEVTEPSMRPRHEWVERTVYHPDDTAMIRRALVAHLRGETPHFTVEYRLQHHSGEWHWYRQRGIAVRDEDGRPYRMAGSMEDISVRKNAEAERARLETQLRQAQKLEAIGTLAGGIAHDFNNILSAILGYGEMAQKGAGDGTPTRRHIDAAMSAGMRAKSLVERILAFSRGGVTDKVPVHVVSAVDEAIAGIQAQLPPDVRLERKVSNADVGVLGDATQVHQVVMNLCANAVHAMRSTGGVLSVTVDELQLEAPRMVATSTLPAGHYVRLAVSDTGSGIAPHVLERIFDPFFTTKEVGVGTGLGLSLVHRIVADLGGGIAVESRVGHGTTFTVYVPWHRYVAAPPPEDERVVQGDGEAVLLVDDEESLVRLGEEMLAELGYEPVGFASSVAALAAFREDPDRFAAVLTDESMPDMSGIELTAEIRRVRPTLPIVLMSGFINPQIAARANDAGIVSVLTKPLVSRDIARSLAAALGH
jgi:PAS domain S-box-containing protein